MASDNARFTHESLENAKNIKELLNALSKGFAKGEMTLGDGDDELVLKTGGLMEVKIKAAREGGRCKVDLRVVWNDPDAKRPNKDALKIVS